MGKIMVMAIKLSTSKRVDLIKFKEITVKTSET